MNIKQRYQLRKVINELGRIRGRHTELVSVYIPAGYDMNKIIGHLQQEQGTAENIKDKNTRTHVIDSLERMVRHLRLFKKTPENGLVVFSGNVAAQEGKTDIKIWSIEPPDPLNFRLYRCDQTFVLDHLRGMLEHMEAYGLIVLDNSEANIAYLKGTAIVNVEDMTSGVPSKMRAGGQCLFSDTVVDNGSLIKIKNIKVGDKLKSFDFKKFRIIESECLNIWNVKKDKIIVIKAGNRKIICSKDHLFFINNKNKIKTKAAEELRINDSLLDSNGRNLKINFIQLIKKPVKMVDIEVKNHNFIANGILVHNSSVRFARLREIAINDFYKRIGEKANNEFLAKKKELKGIIIGGPGPSKESFFRGAYLNNELKKIVLGVKDIAYTGTSGLHDLVERSQDLLVEEEVTKEKKIMQDFFLVLAKTPEKAAYGAKEVEEALEYGAVDTLLLSESLSDEELEHFEKASEKSKSKVQMISIETREGIQLRDLGKVAAILRYALK